MSPIEAKALLKSSSNVLALQTVELIRANGSPDELRRLMDAGAAGKAYRRDPRHPRSMLLADSLLSVCYDDPGAPVATTTATVNGVEVTSATISMTGDVADPQNWKNRVELFKVLLGYPQCVGDSNGMRGGLFDHIMGAMFYHDAQVYHEGFARALIDSGRLNPTTWALRSYQWIGSPAKLAKLRSLGVDISTPGLLDECVAYIGCAPNFPDTKATKSEAIREMLAAGGRISLGTATALRWGRNHQDRATLRGAGLLQPLCAVADPSINSPRSFNAQLCEVFAGPDFAGLAIKLDEAVSTIDEFKKQTQAEGLPEKECHMLFERIREMDHAVQACDLARFNANSLPAISST